MGMEERVQGDLAKLSVGLLIIVSPKRQGEAVQFVRVAAEGDGWYKGELC